jgi:hypothetical protein
LARATTSSFWRSWGICSQVGRSPETRIGLTGMGEMGTIKWGSFITGHLLGKDRRDFLHKAGQGQQFGNASPQLGRRG